MKKLSIGILAHVDAGKTTLSEALLYTAGQIRKLGRVDKRDSFLDHFDQERARGITIFSKQALLKWNGAEITLLDTPGHVDFSAEMERTLQVLDCAILVISGTDGTQAHTDTLWTLLEKYQIPTFIFVTKMDVSHLTRDEILGDLQSHLSGGCIACEELSQRAEDLAVLDEETLENYLANNKLIDGDIRSLIGKRKLFPVFFGSGLKLEGIEPFLDALAALGPEITYPEEFGAKVFKIARDRTGKRMSFLKITGGQIRNRDEIHYLGKEPMAEKISEIRLYSGQKYETAEVLEAGSICAVLGLTETEPGMGLGFEPAAGEPLLEPLLAYRLTLPKGVEPLQVLPKLQLLAEEDPQLHIRYQPKTAEILIRLMGNVQTDVLKELIKDRFDLDVGIDKGRVLYKETIKAPVIGIGHYEPLRHYAEVQLLLEPGDTGSGILIDTAVPPDELAVNWQRLILTHLYEKQHLGVLTGAPITDMKITLISGRAHIKHTEGGDFRQATYRAVRQGLMQAESVLLEPYYRFMIEVPSEQIGRVISDIRNMGGEPDTEMETLGSRTVLHGLAPVETMADYPAELLSFTGGRGRISLIPGGYFPCSNAQRVIEETGYQPEADLDNTPDSVFCSHGAGTVIPWNQVAQYAHCAAPKLFAEAEAESTESRSAGTPRREGSWRSIDDEELEKIMEREFGPIRRKSYTAPVIHEAPAELNTVMRKQFVIVDGYNLIFAWDELKKLAEDSIDAARESLINIMANYRGFTGTETVLIFDAYRVPGGSGEKQDVSGLHVAYTREGETADMYIERLVDDIGKNENVRVVTSDSLIRLSALRSGVLRTSSKEFIAELKDCLAIMRDKLKQF